MCVFKHEDQTTDLCSTLDMTEKRIRVLQTVWFVNSLQFPVMKPKINMICGLYVSYM